jgi:choice-of-anchor B domain-containing protein
MKKYITFLFFAINLIFLVDKTYSQDSLKMTKLSRWDDPSFPAAPPYDVRYNDVWGYVDETGREYALLGSSTHAIIIDVTNPLKPKEIIRFEGGTTTVWRQMKTYKDFVFYVCDDCDEGFMLIDLRPLPQGKPILIKKDKSAFGSSHMLFVDDKNERIYFCGPRLFCFDISNPTDPKLISQVPIDGSIHDMFVKDNICYLNQGYKGFSIWDCKNAANPTRLASIFPTNGYNHSSWLSKDEKWMICAEEVPAGLPLTIINVEKMREGDIFIEHQWKAPLLGPKGDSNMIYHNPYLFGPNDELAIVSSYEDGVTIFDMKNHLNPKLIGYYDFRNNSTYSGYKSCWGVYPFLPSGNILASDMQEGLYILRSSLVQQFLSINDTSKSENELILYNNPVIDELTFSINNFPIGKSFDYKIYNSTGVLIEESKDNSFGESIIKIPTTNWASGAYILEVKIQNKISSTKFIKI